MSRKSASLIGVGAFVTGLSGAVTPGPLLVGCIAEVARFGFIAALLVVAGHVVPELAIVILVGRNEATVRRARRARRAITCLGVAALCLMGVLLLRDGLAGGSVGLVLEAEETGSRRVWGPVVTGLALTLLNPYWWVWWATIGATLTSTAAAQGRSSLIAFFIGHEASDLVWYAIVGALVAEGTGALSPSVYRGLLIGCGIAMFIMAALFALSLVKRPEAAPEAGASPQPE